jgi:CcmD family protein
MRAALLLVLLFIASCSTTPAVAQQPQQEPPKQTDEFVPVSQLPPQDQLPAAPLLVGAYAFVWLALFGYVVSVSRRLSKVQHEVERLEADIAKGTRT